MQEFDAWFKLAASCGMQVGGAACGWMLQPHPCCKPARQGTACRAADGCEAPVCMQGGAVQCTQHKPPGAAHAQEPNAMSLATSTAAGVPSVR